VSQAGDHMLQVVVGERVDALDSHVDVPDIGLSLSSDEGLGLLLSQSSATFRTAEQAAWSRSQQGRSWIRGLRGRCFPISINNVISVVPNSPKQEQEFDSGLIRNIRD
jgi:hypothetical protein